MCLSVTRSGKKKKLDLGFFLFVPILPFVCDTKRKKEESLLT